jgi:N-acetylglucosaminylphosphatidylinositol deacetylase
MSTSAPLSIIVTAHPDDESMFFLPTIRALQKTSKVWLLCLTTGNYAGLGEIRTKELAAVADVLGLEKLIIVDDARLPDHMTKTWDIAYAEQVIAKNVREALLSMEEWAESNECHDIQFVTFDSRGISGHLNHIDTFRAVSRFCDSRGYRFWTTATDWNPFTKYNLLQAPVLVIILVLSMMNKLAPFTSISRQFGSDTVWHVLMDPRLNWRCMGLHASQFVWYRRIFVVFSSYTCLNRLKRVSPAPTKQD